MIINVRKTNKEIIFYFVFANMKYIKNPWLHLKGNLFSYTVLNYHENNENFLYYIKIKLKTTSGLGCIIKRNCFKLLYLEKMYIVRTYVCHAIYHTTLLTRQIVLFARRKSCRVIYIVCLLFFCLNSFYFSILFLIFFGSVSYFTLHE